jgi:hypothetical protein
MWISKCLKDFIENNFSWMQDAEPKNRPGLQEIFEYISCLGTVDFLVPKQKLFNYLALQFFETKLDIYVYYYYRHVLITLTEINFKM